MQSRFGLRTKLLLSILVILLVSYSTLMYYTETDPFTGEAIYVAKRPSERMMQRALIQYKNPQNRVYIRKALKILNKENLKGLFLG